METDYIRVHSCGAVYCLSDCIYFDVLMKVGHPYYLKVCLEEEEGNIVLVFRWDTIPENIKHIYQYVDRRSFMGDNHTLYGCHINRSDDRIYALAKYNENPIGQYVSISDKMNPTYNAKFFDILWNKLKHMKKIE